MKNTTKTILLATVLMLAVLPMAIQPASAVAGGTWITQFVIDTPLGSWDGTYNQNTHLASSRTGWPYTAPYEIKMWFDKNTRIANSARVGGVRAKIHYTLPYGVTYVGLDIQIGRTLTYRSYVPSLVKSVRVDLGWNLLPQIKYVNLGLSYKGYYANCQWEGSESDAWSIYCWIEIQIYLTGIMPE